MSRMRRSVMDRERAIGILSASPFIQKLAANDENLLERLADVAVFTRVHKGGVVFRQGDPGQNCYLILDGQVGVYQYKPRESAGFPTPRMCHNVANFTKLSGEGNENENMKHDRWVTHEGFSTFNETSTLGELLVVLGAGNLFGELALMNNAPRSCSIKAMEPCHMLIIGKEEYNSVHSDILQASEAQVIHDFCEVLREQCGSVVRAWRTVLDPHAVGELLFSEFVEALTGLTWQGNTSALWAALVRRAHANNRDVIVGLPEIAPEDDRIIARFKFWMEDKFDGAIEMFNVLTGNRPNASLSHEDFIRACRSYGHPEQLNSIWEFLDIDGAGEINLKDMAFLESSGLKRKAALEPGFIMALEAAQSAAMNVRHRARLMKRSQDAALTEFMRKLRAASGGSFIRGFRRILDRNGNLTISKAEMLKGCRQVAFGGDVMALWKALDQDRDGFVQLPELDVRMALVLASFKRWSSEEHGSCVKAMQYLASITKRRTAKWNVDDLVAALSQSSWQGIPNTSVKQAAAMLHEACDVIGTRSIVAGDVAFLDTWEPTPWLCAEPDFAGKDRLIATLKKRYINLIVAWRRLFDRNNKNHVTFKDFSNACMHMQLKNAPGIWRALDTAHLGFISVKSIDHDSAQVLLDFKEWAEDTFGSIQFAFRVLDSSHSNSVSLPVFKRVLCDFGFEGDARTLFQSLKPDARGQRSRDARLKLDDMKHLSSWEVRLDDLLDHEDEKPHGEEEQVAEAKGNMRSEVHESLPGIDTVSRKPLQASEASETATETQTASLSNPKSHITSDSLIFCRSPRDFHAFTEVRVSTSRHKSKIYSLTDAMKHKTGLKDTAEAEWEVVTGSPSPYKARVLARVPSIPSINAHVQNPGSAAGKRQQHASKDLSKSSSLPALMGSAWGAGSRATTAKDDRPMGQNEVTRDAKTAPARHARIAPTEPRTLRAFTADVKSATGPAAAKGEFEPLFIRVGRQKPEASGQAANDEFEPLSVKVVLQKPGTRGQHRPLKRSGVN